MVRPQPQNQVVSPFTSKPVVMAKTFTTPTTVQRHTYTSTLVVLIHTSEQQQVGLQFLLWLHDNDRQWFCLHIRRL